MKEKAKTTNIVVTIPEDLRLKLIEEATKLGLGLSPYIRMILFKEMSKIALEDKQSSSYEEEKAG